MTSAVTAADRLGLTLFLAAALHGLLILGVGFASLDAATRSRALDVVLLNQSSDSEPDQADYLSNTDSSGGGDVDEPRRRKAPVSSPEQPNQPGVAPQPLHAGATQPTVARKDPVVTSPDSDDQTAQQPEKEPDRETEQKQKPGQQDYEARAAELAAEIDDDLSEYAQRPRKQFVTARTRASPAATYMHGWTRSVERIGNTNYPKAARDRGLSGSLVVVVAIAADGSLHELHVRASSGHPVLDAAAKRIVRMAAPFESFPDELREKTDILYITRTWQFTPGHRLTSKQQSNP